MVHDRAQSFSLCAYTLHELLPNQNVFLSSSVKSKQLLCSVHGQGQTSKQKYRTKNLLRFHNHSALLTMMK